MKASSEARRFQSPWLQPFELSTVISAIQLIVATGNSFPGRTRPLCRYPAYAAYNGSGDPQDAANFTCTAPKTR